MLLNRIEFILRQMQLAPPDLMPLLEDHDPGVRYLALAVLERHKTVEPATAVAAVRAVLGDPVLRSVGQRAEWSREPAAVAAIGAELAKAPPAEDQLVLLAMLSRAGLAQPGVEGSMLLERLEHPEAGVRQAAVVVLALGAAGDGRAAIAVAGRLQDPARSVRRSALMHLRLLLDKGRGAGKHEIAAEDSLALVKLLLAALPEDDAEQTRRIVGLLGQMQADASPAVPHLLRMLAHEKTPAVRSSVADALAAIAAPSGTNGAVPQTRQVQAALEAVLRDDDSPQVRLAAAEALGRLGQTEAAVAAVIELLRRYSNSFLRTSAARALANYGPQAKDAVSPLVKVVERDPGFVKQQAAAALAAIGSEGIAALTRLLVGQRQPDEVREVAGQALLRAEADKERLVAALVELSRSTEEAERRRAAVYLAELGERPDVAAAVLAAEYRAEEIGSWRLLGSLAKLGPPAVEPLLKLLDEARTADAREQLAQSLAKAAPQDRRVVARLTELLTDKYPQLRAASAVKLAVVHDVPPETLQALAGLLADEETDGVTGERVAQLAARSLIDIGGPAVVAAPQIAAHLEHREARVRRRAADVLAAIGLPEAEDEARPVESKLAALLVDQNDAVRFAAAGALVRHRAMDAAWADLATAALLDEWVTDRAQRWVHAIPHSIFRHEPMPPMEMTHGGRVASYGLPRFPWPPPRPTHRDVIPRQFLGDDQSTLEQVHRRIKQALELVDSSFEYGLFEMAPHADGFTLLARLERIKPDGTPYSQPNRFPTKGGVFPLSLAEYLKQLFMATAGNFRLIAFVITDRQINDWSGQAVPDPGAGTIDLPPELGSKPFKGMYSYALVYVFEKRPGGQPRLLYQTPLNARVHLERAGVWAVLSAP